MNISETKLQAAANHINQISAIAQQLTEDDIRSMPSIKLNPNSLERMRSLGSTSANSSAVNLRDKLQVLKTQHGFTSDEIVYIAKLAIEQAIQQMDETTQFTLMLLDPWYDTTK